MLLSQLLSYRDIFSFSFLGPFKNAMNHPSLDSAAYDLTMFLEQLDQGCLLDSRLIRKEWSQHCNRVLNLLEEYGLPCHSKLWGRYQQSTLCDHPAHLLTHFVQHTEKWNDEDVSFGLACIFSHPYVKELHLHSNKELLTLSLHQGKKRISSFRQLLDQGFSVNEQDPCLQNTILHLAALMTNIERCELIVHYHPDFSLKNHAGHTVFDTLRLAILTKDRLDLLLDTNAFYHTQLPEWDASGQHLIHTAAINGSFKIFQHLITSGVDPFLLNQSGSTVLECIQKEKEAMLGVHSAKYAAIENLMQSLIENRLLDQATQSSTANEAIGFERPGLKSKSRL